jgi:hypothetical protein
MKAKQARLKAMLALESDGFKTIMNNISKRCEGGHMDLTINNNTDYYPSEQDEETLIKLGYNCRMESTSDGECFLIIDWY